MLLFVPWLLWRRIVGGWFVAVFAPVCLVYAVVCCSVCTSAQQSLFGGAQSCRPRGKVKLLLWKLFACFRDQGEGASSFFLLLLLVLELLVAIETVEL